METRTIRMADRGYVVLPARKPQILFSNLGQGQLTY